MIRLICIDVDGTLVGSGSVIDPGVWDAAQVARQAGIRLALCSGRPGFGITSTYAERLAPGGWHAFQNGASVVHLADQRSLSARIPSHIVNALVARSRDVGRLLELYGDHEYATERDTDRSRAHAELLGVPFRLRPFESLDVPIVRAQWLVSTDGVGEVFAEPHAGLEMSRSTSPVMPGTEFVNMTLAGVDKSTAVRTIAGAYAVPLEQVMYVGDGQNDIPAMRIVGHSIAMGNADPEVRATATQIVAGVDDGGLVDALKLALVG